MLATARELLDRTGFTLGQVHRATRIDRSHLIRMFGGKVTPRVSTALTICAYLGIRLDELYKAIGK